MKNVYTVNLVKPVKMDASGHHFTGKETSWLHVTASSFENALAAVRAKYPDVGIRSINVLNYDGVPIVAGE